MIVKDAYGAEANVPGNLEGLGPSLGVQFPVLALPFFRVPPGAVFAVHLVPLFPMLSFCLPLLAAFPLSQTPPIRLDLRGGEFVIRSETGAERVSLAQPSTDKPADIWPPKRVLFRKDAAYAVWDSRGLSVRQGSWVFTSKLSEIPLSPKLFSREEILQTKEMIEAGKRKTQVSGLSGAVRDGGKCYFLARWEERGGKPWLEALIQVDLTEGKPKPHLMGRFEGSSLDLKPGSSRLFIREAKPAAWIKSDVGSSRVDLQACKLEYSIVSPK